VSHLKNTLEVSFDGLSCGVTRAHLLMFAFSIFTFVYSRCTSLASVACCKDRLLGEPLWWGGLCVVRRASALYQLAPLVLQYIPTPMHQHAHEQGVVICSVPFGRSCYTILPCHYGRCSTRSLFPFTSAGASIMESTHLESFNLLGSLSG
jgi:hypothetical protein